MFLVARIAGSIAGYSIACLTRHGGEIASLAVGPPYRRSGVATALLRATIRKLKHAGAASVWLIVRRENREAIQLYRKLGFLRTATVPHYYGDGSSGWRMRLRLSSPADRYHRPWKSPPSR
jgi:ribosomal protein S18 acetylase RimI-like enzyme